MQKILLAFITLALFLPNLFTSTLQTSLPFNGKEKFEPALSGINSVARLEKYTDSVATAKNIPCHSFAYVELLNNVLERRFYHGFSHYSLSENWIAALAGKLVKEDYSCKVQPDEILGHANAACSQQALVMMQVLRDKNISYRPLGFPHHYAIEVLADGQWYFFDTNMEPVVSKAQRSLAHWQHRNDVMKQYYDPVIHTNINYQFGNHTTALIAAVNEEPGKRVAFFHVATGIFSKIGWLIPLLLLLYKGGFNMYVPFISVMTKRKRPVVVFGV
jgi:hypothetical protein